MHEACHWCMHCKMVQFSTYREKTPNCTWWLLASLLYLCCAWSCHSHKSWQISTGVWKDSWQVVGEMKWWPLKSPGPGCCVSIWLCVSLILVSIIFILSGFYFNPSLWQWDKCCSKIRVFFLKHVAGNSSCGTICSYPFFFFQNGYSSPVMRDNRICSGGRGGHWRGIWRRFRLHWSEWTQRLCSLLTYRGESYLCWNLVLWKSWILDLRMF